MAQLLKDLSRDGATSRAVQLFEFLHNAGGRRWGLSLLHAAVRCCALLHADECLASQAGSGLARAQLSLWRALQPRLCPAARLPSDRPTSRPGLLLLTASPGTRAPLQTPSSTWPATATCTPTLP
jgi:hypothetical protein